jgi:hypothetical protein
LQQPGDDQDDDDAPRPRQGDTGLVVEAVQVLEKVLN